MDRVYFDINEKLAKQAHDMMSFRDYSPGRLTAEYRGYVDKAYDLADEAAKERPESAEKAYKLAERYSKRMADNLNASSRIGCMCPSVMVCGAGNFPVRKKEKQNAAADKNYKEFQEIQKLLDKIRGIINGKDIILSGEADAIQRLESKLGMMKAEQEKMKAANKAIRLNDEAKGNQKLKEMGYTDEQIIELTVIYKPRQCDGKVLWAQIGILDNMLFWKEDVTYQFLEPYDSEKKLRKAYEKHKEKILDKRYGEFEIVDQEHEMRRLYWSKHRFPQRMCLQKLLILVE